MSTLIYDGDEILYQSCKGSEKEVEFDDWHAMVCRWPDVQENVLRKVETAKEATGCDEVIFALSCKGHNFRKDVAKSYKGNRKETKKPLAYSRGYQWLMDQYETYVKPGLEADDVMGLMSAQVDWIVSSDKDMKTIPHIKIYSPYHDEAMGPYSEEESNTFWMYQTLVGDIVDGYKGCPRIGAVGAKKILDDLAGEPLSVVWGAVCKAFTKAKLTKSDALVQARLARILRPGEYSDLTSTAHLWSPV